MAVLGEVGTFTAEEEGGRRNRWSWINRWCIKQGTVDCLWFLVVVYSFRKDLMLFCRKTNLFRVGYKGLFIYDCIPA